MAAQNIRKATETARKGNAVTLDGWVKVSYRKDGFHVSTINPDGTYEKDTEAMSQHDAYDELYYLLCE